MPLFESPDNQHDEIVGTDAASRALSVAAVENDFVARVYEKLASTYDFTFGPTLHPGRVQALQRMGIKAGDRVLEVGVGTGINTHPEFGRENFDAMVRLVDRTDRSWRA